MTTQPRCLDVTVPLQLSTLCSLVVPVASGVQCRSNCGCLHCVSFHECRCPRTSLHWRKQRLATSLPVKSSVKTSCVETLDYSGYEHYHNYGLIGTNSQLLSSSIECVVR